MPIIEDIRRLDCKGVSGRQIAARLGVSRDTVAKYLGVEDFSPPAPTPARSYKRSVMTEEVCAFIKEVLEADRGASRKQRHTAKRIFERLVAEHGFTGSYRSVTAEVAKWKQHHGAGRQTFKELAWAPETMQVDFGAGYAVARTHFFQTERCGPTRPWLPRGGYDWPMPAPKCESPDAYFDALNVVQKPHLEDLRRLSLSFIPRVEETLKWNTPSYVSDKKLQWMLQAFQGHCSLRFSPDFFGQYKDEVEAAGYEGGAGFLKIPYTSPVPEALCRRLMEARLEDDSK